jgi:hypothetical protein
VLPLAAVQSSERERGREGGREEDEGRGGEREAGRRIDEEQEEKESECALVLVCAGV